MERRRVCEPFHGVGIDAEPESPRESDIKGLVPVAVEPDECLLNALHFLIKPLVGEAREPVGDIKPWKSGDFARAGRESVAVDHLVVAHAEIGCAIHYQLCDFVTVGALDAHIVAADDVEYYRVIGHVVLMAVAIPVGGFDMYFDIATPCAAAYAEFGVEEVGSGVVVVQAGVDDLNPASVDCLHFALQPQFVLPYVVHKSLHRSKVSKFALTAKN